MMIPPSQLHGDSKGACMLFTLQRPAIISGPCQPYFSDGLDQLMPGWHYNVAFNQIRQGLVWFLPLTAPSTWALLRFII